MEIEKITKEEREIVELQDFSEQLRKKGQNNELIDVLERLAIARKKCLGEDHTKTYEELCEVLNVCAMNELKDQRYDESLVHLRRAEEVSELVGQSLAGGFEKAWRMKAITFNNYACLYKKTNKIRSALKYLQAALEIEQKIGSSASLADTHLNLGAIFSHLSNTHNLSPKITSSQKHHKDRHQNALEHSLMGIVLLQDELLQDLLKQQKKPATKQQNRTTSSMQLSAVIPKNRAVVLTIALHNLAAELEHLKRVRVVISSHKKDSVSTSEHCSLLVATSVQSTHQRRISLRQWSHQRIKTFQSDLQQSKRSLESASRGELGSSMVGVSLRPSRSSSTRMSTPATSTQLTTLTHGATTTNTIEDYSLYHVSSVTPTENFNAVERLIFRRKKLQPPLSSTSSTIQVDRSSLSMRRANTLSSTNETPRSWIDRKVLTTSGDNENTYSPKESPIQSRNNHRHQMKAKNHFNQEPPQSHKENLKLSVHFNKVNVLEMLPSRELENNVKPTTSSATDLGDDDLPTFPSFASDIRPLKSRP